MCDLVFGGRKSAAAQIGIAAEAEVKRFVTASVAAFQNALERLVVATAKRQRACAGRFEQRRAVAFAKPDYALSCTQALHHAIPEQGLHEVQAVRANRLGSPTKPLAIPRKKRLRRLG